MRICPRCTYPLEHIQDPARGATLDHCRRCKGSFLEPGQAGKAFGELIEPTSWLSHSSTLDLGPSKLLSPIDRQPMHAYVVSSGSAAVEVDVCNTSRGLWLDAEEGRKLLKIMTENQKNKDKEHPDVQEPGILSYIFQLLTSFPLEVYNPVRKHPVALYTIFGLIVACFVGQLWYLYGDQPTTALYFFNQVGSVPAQIMHGSQLWGLITYAFFHGGLMHIFGNLYFLYTFGDNVEDTLGPTKFLLIFFISSVVGGLLHCAFFPSSSMPLVGASGAISGLMGAYLLLFPEVEVWIVFFFVRFRLNITVYFLFWIGYQILMAWVGFQKTGGGVAWLAHIGGFGAGVLLGVLWRNSSAAVRLRQAPA